MIPFRQDPSNEAVKAKRWSQRITPIYWERAQCLLTIPNNPIFILAPLQDRNNWVVITMQQFGLHSNGCPITFFKLKSCCEWLQTQVKHKTSEIVQNHALGLRRVGHRKCSFPLSDIRWVFPKWVNPNIWNSSASSRGEAQCLQTSPGVSFSLGSNF